MELKRNSNEDIGDWFTPLLELKNQVDGAPEAITPVMFKTHVFTSLPDAFAVTSKIQQNNINAIIEEVIEALKEDEKVGEMRVKTEPTTDAFVAARGRSEHGLFGRGGGRGFTTCNNTLWCSFYCSATHSTEACRSRHRPEQRQLHDTDFECFYCGERGHYQRDCPIKHRGEQAEARASKRVKVEVDLGEKEAGGGH